MTTKSLKLLEITINEWRAPLQGAELARACLGVIHKTLGDPRDSYGTLRSDWHRKGYCLPPDGLRPSRYAYEPGVFMCGAAIRLELTAESHGYAYTYQITAYDPAGRAHHVFGARAQMKVWSVLEWLTGRTWDLQERRRAVKEAGLSWEKRTSEACCPECGHTFKV